MIDVIWSIVGTGKFNGFWLIVLLGFFVWAWIVVTIIDREEKPRRMTSMSSETTPGSDGHSPTQPKP